jgi:PIN domain nuclease of toxin-antitoxin system
LRFTPEKISKAQMMIIQSPDEEKFVSSITAWEISLKFALGKLELGGQTPDEFVAGSYKLGIRNVTATTDQYATYYLLPKMDKHKDPFDRMIIWHALQSGLTLISSDKQLSQYKPHGLEVV